MSGIEILNSYQIVETSWGICKEGIICLIMAIICFLLFFFFINKDNLWSVLFALGAFFLFVFALIYFQEGNRIEITRYEVIISDEVNYNEFTKKYEVIEQRGKILVVEEKNVRS